MGADFDFSKGFDAGPGNQQEIRQKVLNHGRDLISEAQWDSGHGGYTGTFAEAADVDIVNTKFSDGNVAEAWLEETCQKWGPMIAVPYSDGETIKWAFGALCSS